MKEFSLVGVDGNAFSVIGYVQKAMRKTGFTSEEIDDYRSKATSGDYSNLLLVSCEQVDECNKRLN